MGTSNPDVGGISELIPIYYQDAFSPPIDNNVLKELKNVDWFSMQKTFVGTTICALPTLQ